MKTNVVIFQIFILSCAICSCKKDFPPVANFTSLITTITIGDSVQFTDQSTNTPTSWQWDFGDGTTNSQQNPVKTYNTAGTFTVKLTASNVYGSDTKTIKGYIKVTDTQSFNGYTYKLVKIGTQLWFSENLQTTKYNDGTDIPNVTSNSSWVSLTSGAYCWYNNDAATYKNLYGALYNWYAIKTGKLCPAEWHVPTDAEWTKLENYLITNGYNYDGTTSGNKIAKSMAATTNWQSSTNVGDIGNNLSLNNLSGFSALPGGYRGSNGGFFLIGNYGNWWSSTELSTDNAWSRTLVYRYTYVSRDNKYYMDFGFSVRCLRDF